MSRRIRRVAIVAGLIGLVLVASVAVLSKLEFERHRRIAERELSAALGLKVKIEGALRLSLFPGLHLEASDVTIANLPNRPSPELARIGTIELALDIWNLLFGVIEVDALGISDAEFHIETDSEERFELSHDVESLADEPAAEQLAIRIRGIELERVHVSYRSGRTGAVTAVWVDSLMLEADDFDAPINLLVLGDWDGSEFDLEGEFGSLPELLRPTTPYPVLLRGQMLEAQVELQGTIEEPTQLRGIDLAFAVEIRDLSALYREADAQASPIGPVRVGGRLTNPDGVYGVEGLTITSASGALRGEITGSVRDLMAFRGIELRGRLEADDLRAIQPFTDQPLPELSVIASMEASDRDGSLGLDGEMHASAPSGALSIDISGGQDDLRKVAELDVRIRVHAEDLPLIGELIGLEYELPPLGPVVASARLRDHAGAIGLDEIDVRVGRADETWAEVQGSVRDAIQFEGVDLKGRFGAADLRHARPYMAREPPDVGPFTGIVALADLDGTLGVEHFSIRGGHDPVFQIELSGVFDHVRGFDEIEVQVKLEASDLAVIGGMFDTDLPPIGPVKFAGSLSGADERIDSTGTMRLGETRIAGKWSGSFAPGARPSLHARLQSDHVRLQDLGLEPRYLEGEAPGPVRTVAGRWWAGSDTLDFDALRAIDADVALHAKRISGRAGLELEQAQLSLRLDDGELVARLDDGRFESGTLGGELRVDARTPLPSMALRAVARGLNLATLMSQFEEETQTAGTLDARIDVESRGDTRDAIRSNLSGRFVAVLKDAALASSTARAFFVNLARVSLPRLRASRVTPVGCLALDFEIDEGVATARTLLLEGRQATITGSGRIDLARRQYNLRLIPVARDPALLGVAVTVDVTGPLVDPVFRPVARSLVTSATRGMLDNARRPARALLRPFRRGVEEDGDPCADPLAPVAGAGQGGRQNE